MAHLSDIIDHQIVARSVIAVNSRVLAKRFRCYTNLSEW